MTPTYEVVPGKRVGIFELGDTLWHVLDILRTDKVTYPKLELAWDEDCSAWCRYWSGAGAEQQKPHKSPVTLHIPQPPLTLFFDATHQRLSQITIPLPSSLTLTYETQVLSGVGAGSSLTRAKVGRILGPTHDRAGERNLIYPGIEFWTNGAGGRDEGIEKIRILPRSAEVGGEGLQRCAIMRGKGVTLHFQDQEPLEVVLGQTTSQDILVDIGAPLRKYWKEDDRVERMWGGQNGESSASKGQCFWNYFQYGLDFLIDAEGTVIKIIVHSNIPGTPLFQRYARCPWSITSSSENLDLSSSMSTFRSSLGGSSAPPTNPDEVRLTVPDINSGSGGGKKKKRSGSSTSATSATSGASDTKVAGTDRKVDDVPEAMYLDRLSEGGLDGVRGLGGSRLVGFDGLVVEEDQEHGGICSVLVYEHRTPP